MNGSTFILRLEFERLELKPSRTAVEINRSVVPKAEYARTQLKAGDHVEVINFVGGG